ncbi:MAG: 50S ribosomal protein L4 [Chromatiales bacterium 21-64-14]|nr:MAG: 50S ribosomal protein L4 [Chromatiales bacterium 21-64-14]HQU15010.1 50S ribosomal protein L4 [Gammaproteobacteria bacterium]
MNLAVHDSAKGAKLEVSESAFGSPFNEPLIHQVVVAYLAGARSGTAAQKNRSDVSGGGAKPWRQKGTGRARAGTTRSPLWRGGGATFAARPRDYGQKVNRKMYRTAMRSILSELVRQERLVVVEDLGITQPKTRDLRARLQTLGLVGSILVVAEEVDGNIYLAARNLPHVEVIDVAGVDPASLVGFDHVLTTVAAVRRLEEWLA